MENAMLGFFGAGFLALQAWTLYSLSQLQTKVAVLSEKMRHIEKTEETYKN